jgi:hypothetical protein
MMVTVANGIFEQQDAEIAAFIDGMSAGDVSLEEVAGNI